MTLKWYGDAVYRELVKDARGKVAQCCLLTEAGIKLLMKAGGRAPGGDFASVGVSRVSQFAGKRGARQVQSSARYIDIPSGKRISKAAAQKRLKKINAFTSKPGEPPRVQTGVLRRGYTHEIHPTLPIGRVGTNIPYAKWLEFGTRRMAARPHVRPVLHSLEPVYRTIFGAVLGSRGPISGGPGMGAGL